MAVEETDTLSIAGPLVISETIDDETVIIDLDKGAYYSLKGAGPFIWALIQEPVLVSDVLASILSAYDVDKESAWQELSKLLSYFLEEGPIKRAETALAGAALKTKPDSPRIPFVAPAIQKFTDMEAMLLLDPIHDVDDEGWPNLPTAMKQDTPA